MVWVNLKNYAERDKSYIKEYILYYFTYMKFYKVKTNLWSKENQNSVFLWE